jgi:hypothetical protein
MREFLEWARVLGLIGKLKTKKKVVAVEKKAGPTTTRLSSWQLGSALSFFLEKRLLSTLQEENLTQGRTAPS